jgi:plastocyanin
MSRSRASIPVIVALATAGIALSAPASAQTACITPNCAFGATPAACVNRASPRTPTVLMGSGVSLIFVPANPRIEPGDCILWRAATITHSSSGSACPTSTLCNSPAPAACEWETANVSSASATPTSTCFYDPVSYPATAAEPYYCRFHSATMRGTLQVTTPIQLSVSKEIATSSVKLVWTGGGVTGDVSYKVARQSGGDPHFPTATTTTVNPDGGVLGTTFTDTGDLGNSTTRYYLVRNKQTNES